MEVKCLMPCLFSSRLAHFHGVVASFEQYPRDWHIWYTNATPETAVLPGNTLARGYPQIMYTPSYVSLFHTLSYTTL